MKQKTSIQETDSQETSPVEVICASEVDTFAGLSTSLAEIRKLKGVLGYILRSNTSAIVDLIEQEKIVPYTVLSTQISDVGMQVADQFKLGTPESILLEGKNIKVLCATIGENKVSIFMEKTVSHTWITKKIRL